jgi:hypothetical protein
MTKVIANANGFDGVSESEIAQLSEPTGRLFSTVLAMGRDFYLRRQAGNARLTIFEGGHEGIATATWLGSSPIPS